MSEVFVNGWGAVSPAGWGVQALTQAIEAGTPLPTQPLFRQGRSHPYQVRDVPPCKPAPALFAHPRLRRASQVTLFAAWAMTEALQRAGAGAPPAGQRLGLIVCALTGCVQYSHRFFEEALKDPATASPLLFPETVFNAPGSHLASLLGQPPVSTTLLGDPATFLQGIALAAEWLLEERVEGCLVVGAEELDWITADAFWYFNRGANLAAGAGALFLSRQGRGSGSIKLDRITGAHTYSSRQSRAAAARNMRQDLPPGGPGELLCDSCQGRSGPDAAELAAWQDWTGSRLSPKTVLGDGLMACGAWQCVMACEALVQDRCGAASVSVVGHNQQALGARFVKT